MTKIPAISGSYRDGGIADQVVETMTDVLCAEGAAVDTIPLRDYPIEFCLSRRECTQQPAEAPGVCVQKDGLQALVDKIESAQYEYSLWWWEAETALLPTLRELGIALVAWSPLGGGIPDWYDGKLDENDFSQNNPRFAGDNLAINTNRFAPIMQLVNEHDATPAQIQLDESMLNRIDGLARPGLAEGATLL